ncbi:MAG: N-acetylglucosamine-6-phosphate deacetylase, partial [Thermocrispum sp.]
MTLYAAEHLLAPEGLLEPGWLRVEGDRIAEVGAGAAAPGAQWLDGWVLPGFVDIHVHGGGGASYTTGDATQA